MQEISHFKDSTGLTRTQKEIQKVAALQCPMPTLVARFKECTAASLIEIVNTWLNLQKATII